MKFRTHKMSTNVVYGVGLAGFTTIVFFLMNAGIDPRAHRVGDFDPAGAGIVGIGLYGLYHTIAIIFFNEDDSSDKDAPAPDHHVPRAPDSYTGFIRQAWYKVFSVGPIWAFFSAASIFIWHSFAKSTGTPGTIWGDYSASPLPALVIFFACWSAVNLGFTLSAVAEAFNRDHPAVFIIMLVTMFLLGIGLTFVFMFPIPEMSTGSGLSLVTITLPLSLLALFGTRLWAVVRVARCDAAHPHLSPRQQHRRERFDPRHQDNGGPRAGAVQQGSAVPHATAAPPTDLLQQGEVLQPGEALLLQFRSDLTPEPQMLIATNRRVVRASVNGQGRSVVLDQAQPGQLMGGSCTFDAGGVVTTAHFRGRAEMRLLGGDPAQSQRFAEALTRLARTGRTTP